MDKYTRDIMIMLLIAVVFVVGLKIGENHVINHQHIEKTNTGYIVEFDGQNYKYAEG